MNGFSPKHSRKKCCREPSAQTSKPTGATSTVHLHELMKEGETSKENETSIRDGEERRGGRSDEERRDGVKVDEDADGMID